MCKRSILLMSLCWAVQSELRYSKLSVIIAVCSGQVRVRHHSMGDLRRDQHGSGKDALGIQTVRATPRCFLFIIVCVGAMCHHDCNGYRYSNETCDELLKSSDSNHHESMLSALSAMWQGADSTKMVPTTPLYVRDIVVDCTVADSDSRPDFGDVVKHLISGPMRRFSEATHGGRSKLHPSPSTSALFKSKRAPRRRSTSSHRSNPKRQTASTYGLSKPSDKRAAFSDQTAASVRDALSTDSSSRNIIDAEGTDAGGSEGSPTEDGSTQGDDDTDGTMMVSSVKCCRKYRMGFPDPDMERRFCAEYVQSDSHYQTARFALYILSSMYMLYFLTTFSLRSVYNLSEDEDSDPARTIAAPLLNVFVYTMAVVLAHKPAWRKYAEYELIFIIPAGVCACIVVPWISYMALDVTNGDLFTGGLFGHSHLASGNSTFVNGWLVNEPGVCGGIGSSDSNDTHAVSLCQSFAFNAGVGNLMFFMTNVPVMHALTLPAIFLSLGLPFRSYIVAVLAPLVGLCVQIYTIYQEVQLSVDAANFLISAHVALPIGTQYTWLYVTLYGVIVYSSCIASALSNERYNRSLFTIQCALSERKEALLSERDETRYRYILKQNRDLMNSEPHGKIGSHHSLGRSQSLQAMLRRRSTAERRSTAAGYRRNTDSRTYSASSGFRRSSDPTDVSKKRQSRELTAFV